MIVKPYLKILLFTGLLHLAIPVLFSQNQSTTDSLKRLLKSTKQDSLRIKYLFTIADLLGPLNSDSAEFYYTAALKEAQKSSGFEMKMQSYNKLGVFYINTGNYEKANQIFKEDLILVQKSGDKKNLAYCYNYIGEVYMCQCSYPKSLKYYQKAIKLFEELDKTKKDYLVKKGMVMCYNNVGAVHAENGNYDQATDYFKKALAAEEQVGDKLVIAGCNNNIGNVYYMQGKYPEALKFYMESLKIIEELQVKSSLSEEYNNIGVVLTEMHKNKEAIAYYEKSLMIDKELGDQKGVSLVLGNIALLKTKLGSFKEAIEYAEKSLDIALKIGSLDEQKCAYEYLAAAYDSLGNYKKTCQYLKLFKLINDSIYNIESGRQVKEMEAVYQSEKKQKEIELLNKSKELQEIEISKQEMLKYSFIIGFVLMLILSIVVFRSYSQKKKANTLLTLQKNQIEEKNEELNQQNEEISAQRDEIESQRDLVMSQKEKIEEIHSELTSSIHYAKRIQNAVLPNKEFVETLLTDYFILFKPRDIVSGDFYWLTLRKNFILVAVADCTGHGVPGAFMSMLGMSFLNEIVTREDVNQANKVLNELREYVLKSLQQKGVSGEQKDGMDIAFISINLESTFSESGVEQFSVQFAGANNSLYYIQNNLLNVTNNTIEIKGDKMPVSIYRNMPGFTNHDLLLQKGDIIYLSTDGFSDQFGGPNQRKYLSKTFKNLLQEVSVKPMEDQKVMLNETIELWKNSNGNIMEQTDDITVMGIKI